MSPDITPVAEVAMDLTMDRLPRHLATEQLDAILGMVDEALRTRLESRIMGRHEYRSELFRGIYQQGVAAGEAKAEARGEAKGRAESVLIVLAARGIPAGASLRRRILACADTKTLDTWLRRAAIVTSAAAVVDAEPTRPAARRSAKRAVSTARSRATTAAGMRSRKT